MRQNFSAFITKARRDKNLSQVEVAKKIGLTQAQICNIEKGVYFPSVDTLVKLSLLYDITLDDMLGITRENRMTVNIGDPQSEKKLLSMMLRHHKLALKKAIKDKTIESEDIIMAYKEVFEYIRWASEGYVRDVEDLMVQRLHDRYDDDTNGMTEEEMAECQKIAAKL